VLVVSLVLVLSMVPGTALAHPLLVRAEPADNARLETAPREVRLWFSDPVSPQLSSVQVLDVHGMPVVGAKLVADSARLGHLAVELPELEPGAYNVVWKVFSESDGHTVRGHLVFGIGAAVEAGTLAPAPELPLPALEIVLRWVGLAATLALVGAVAARLTFLGSHLSTWYAVLCGGVAVLAGAATATQTDIFAGLVTDSRWGTVWAAREGLLLLLITLLATRRMSRSIIAALCLAVLVTQALTGHASASPMGVLVDTLHLLAASVWLGGLLALLLARRHVSRATWVSFGQIAGVCVGILIATGLYSAGQQAASVDAVLTTLYGDTLLIKVGLVLLLLGSALIARLRLVTKFLVLEIGVGGLVLLAASVLASSAPARGPTFEPPIGVPSVASQSAHDLLVTLEVKPNQPGANVLTVRAVSTRRPPPAPIDRLAVQFTPSGASEPIASSDAIQAEPGLFRLGGDFLNASGSWHIQVIAQRRGLPDEAARFDWTVAPLTPPRLLIVSDQPLAPQLTAAAAATGLATLILAAIARSALPRPWRRLRILRSHTHVHQEGVSP
jgi:copper transport protein